MSDSDKTVDSDELKTLIDKSNQDRKRTSGVHDISDDSDTNDCQTDLCKERPHWKANNNEKLFQEEVDKRPVCKYGSACYRNNPEHHRQFQHPAGVEASNSKRMKLHHAEGKGKTKPWQHIRNFNFFFTTVSGIKPNYNETVAKGIKDLLRPSEGTLKASAQFNYMVDVPWLIKQYPPEFRSCPLLIVHGEVRDSKRELEQSAKSYPNVTFCQAKLEIMFGTHHTKMMLLLYEDGLRVIIHTSNLIDGDWYQKTQGMWVSPKFPPLPASSTENGESCTMFKADLLEYLSSYNNSALLSWCENIKRHDLSSASVFLIGSVPGRHIGSRKTAFGHLKVRKVLTARSTSVTSDWPVIGQFSSIGSLGANQNQWLCGEWLTSFSTTKGASLIRNAPLKLIFPSVDNVRTSLEGYPAGACLPYSKSTASKQPYLTSFMHQWKSSYFGRSQASPHIKSYCRISPEMAKIAWFLLTSANLSKAAWGVLEKNGSQLMIRSYEIGVLFIPHHMCSSDYFSIQDGICNNSVGKFPLPYDVPLTPYKSTDEPWIWDIPHTAAPDRHGNMWCPGK